MIEKNIGSKEPKGESCMKLLLLIVMMGAVLVFGLPVWAQTAQVTKVSTEKFNNLTPEQQERFREMGRQAQSAAEASIKDYNQVEKEATNAKNVAEAVHDTAVEFNKQLTGR